MTANDRQGEQDDQVDDRRSRPRQDRGLKAEVQEEGPGCATSRTRGVRSGQVHQEGHPAKKAPTGHARAEVAPPTLAREGSKTAKIMDLLKRPSGATLQDLMKTTGWLPHSVRGFLSGTVGKKMGLTVTSVKGEDGDRTYSVEG